MHIEELNLPTAVTQRLREAGLHTVTAVLEAGTDGLQAIDGIGPKIATDVLVAAHGAHGHSAPANDAPAQTDPDAQPSAPAPNAHGDADAQVPLSAAGDDPDAPVTVRNVSDALVLVGERYLLPGQTRTVRRRLLRHIAPDKLAIG